MSDVVRVNDVNHREVCIFLSIAQRCVPQAFRNRHDVGHRAYLGEATPITIETKPVLAQMGKRIGQARRAYLQFLQEGLGSGHEEKYYQTTDQRFLGDEAFVEKVASTAKDKDIRPTGPRVNFERLLAVVCKKLGLTEDVLIGSGRRKDRIQARRQLVYLAREWANMTTRELGNDSSVIR